MRFGKRNGISATKGGVMKHYKVRVVSAKSRAAVGKKLRELCAEKSLSQDYTDYSGANRVANALREVGAEVEVNCPGYYQGKNEVVEYGKA
jgi:folylpolyglutamate synthase/dihydropteroate synthase